MMVETVIGLTKDCSTSPVQIQHCRLPLTGIHLLTRQVVMEPNDPGAFRKEHDAC